MKYTDKLLEAVLGELKNIHSHLDRLNVFYKMVNKIREDQKTGAWIEDSPQDKRK